MGGGRSEAYEWHLLDMDDQQIGEITTVATGARLEFNQAARIRGGGTLTIVDAGADIDWLTVRIQPWYRNLTTGEAWPLGVFLPIMPEVAYTPVGRSWQGSLLDKTAILDTWLTSETYTVGAGVNLVGAAVAALAVAGQTRVTVSGQSGAASGSMVWEAGTSILRIVNDLLAAANYAAVWADRWGVFHLDPYTLPTRRGVVAEFIEGEGSFHRGDWTFGQDRTSVPNHVVCVGQPRPGDLPPLVGEAANTDPSSPFSIPSRGRRISLSYQNVEAADQATIDAIARRRLVENSTPAVTYRDVHHAQTLLDLGDVVRFRSQGEDTLATVQKMTVTCDPGELVTAEWRRVEA